MTTNTVTPATIRAAKQILEDRSNERARLDTLTAANEALTVERDGLAQALAETSTDFRLAARTLLHTRKRQHAQQQELKLLQAVITEFRYACEQVLGGGDLRLLGQALERAKIAPVPQTTCTACGAAHDVQRCGEVGDRLHEVQP